jgi:hypothetical protein
MQVQLKEDGLFVHIEPDELGYMTTVVRAIMDRLRFEGYRDDSDEVKECTEICAYILKTYFEKNNIRSFQ